jgi:tRNA pseudouridine13 synthase
VKGEVKDEDVCEDQEDVIIDENNQKQTEDNSEIKVLDGENIHNYELKDVVLPVYGSKTVIPNDSILSSLIEQVFLEEGITREDFEEASKRFYLDGGQRYLTQIPEQFEFEIVYFDDRE